MISTRSLYEIEVLVDAPSLFLDYRETSGTAAEDISGNGLDGVHQNAPTLAVGSIVDRKTGVTYNGTTQYTSVADDPLADPGDTFTLEAWVNFTALPAVATLAYVFHKGINGYGLLVDEDGGIYFTKVDAGNIAHLTNATPAGAMQHHLVVTKSGATVHMYKDGVDLTSAVTNLTIVATASNLNLGRSVAGASYLNGSIDKPAIYPTALSASRVLAHYLRGAQYHGVTPLYAVLIQNADETGTAHRFVTYPPKGGGLFATAQSILMPETIERAADPRDSRFEVGEFSFSLLDIAGAATAVIADLIGKQVTLYTLDYSSDWTNAEILFVGILQEFSQSESGYRLTARSPIVLADTTIFNAGKTTIVTGINSSDVAVIVADASAFADSGVLLIESERITYTGRTDNTGSWTLTGLTRGYLASTAASHAAGAAVAENFVLGPAHPYDILSDLLSNPADGKTGLGMADYVHTVDLAAQKTAIGATLEMFFEVTSAENAKAWIEREILKATGAYPFDNNEGLIGLKTFSTSSSTVDTIEDADCLERAQWTGNFPRRVNQVTFLYDWDPVTSKFLSAYPYQDDGLVERDGPFPLVIEAKGIHSGLTDTAELLSDRSAACVQRFGLELPTMSAQTLFAKRYIEAADDVGTTFARMANLSAAVVGLENAPAEIIGIRHNLMDGNMEFDLFAYGPIFDVLTEEDLFTADTSTLTETIA